jgi:hypothetical protein
MPPRALAAIRAYRLDWLGTTTSVVTPRRLTSSYEARSKSTIRAGLHEDANDRARLLVASRSHSQQGSCAHRRP